MKNYDIIASGSDWKKEITTQAPGKIRDQLEFQGVTCILYPDDTFVIYWNRLITLLLIYTATVTPYRIAFIDSDPLEWVVADLVIDFFFFIDVVIECSLAFYDEENNLEFRRKKIFKNYLKSWFFPDLVACFPIQLLLVDKDYNSLIRVARLPKLYRLIKITKLLRITKMLKLNNNVRYVYQLIRAKIAYERLAIFVVSFFMMIHLLCCFYVFTGKLNEINQYDNWIRLGNFQDYSNLNLYLVGCYWAVTTLTTVGYGDIAATNTLERLLSCLVMIIGVLTYSYTIGAITNLISSLDNRSSELNRKLDILNQLARDHGLSKIFFKKLTKAIEYEHSHSKKDLEEILSDLPKNLSKQLLIATYERKISYNHFFLNKSGSFVAWVIPYLRGIRVERGECIYSENEFATEIYFVIRGEAAMVIVKKFISLPFIYFDKGSYFGDSDLLYSENKCYLNTMKAMDDCELLTLSRDMFIELLYNFEEEAVEICTNAKQKLDEYQEKKLQAEEEYKLQNKLSTLEDEQDEKPKETLQTPTQSHWASFKNFAGSKKQTQEEIVRNSRTVAGNFMQTIKGEPDQEEFPQIKNQIRKLEYSVETAKTLCMNIMEAFERVPQTAAEQEFGSFVSESGEVLDFEESVEEMGDKKILK